MYAIRSYYAKGLLKILSKMGISTVASYRGAQLFEAVGLADEVVDLSFCGVASRIKGARFSVITSYSIHYTKLYEAAHARFRPRDS